MFPLLTIPVELRILIIEHVLFTPLSPPATLPEPDGIEYKPWPGRRGRTYYKQQRTSSSSSCLPLLLTNRQISAETRRVLGDKKTDYIIDMSVKDDFELFLTWLSVPRLTTRISTLYANVRIFGHIIEKSVVRSLMAKKARPDLHWLFYRALERFLRYGPVGIKEHEEKEARHGFRHGVQQNPEFPDRGILIDTLVLDFQSAELELAFPPEAVTYRHWSKRRFGSDRGDQSELSETLSSYTTRPEWVCIHLENWIDGLLSMTYSTSVLGQHLYAHIGTIRMLVDGKLHCEFDLTDWLARLEFTDLRHMMGHLLAEDRESGFWKWKRETILLREARGFPVEQLSDAQVMKWDEERLVNP